MDEPEPRTIRAAADGDIAAFSAIVRAYQVPVWRFLRHLVGDAELAEDLTQETFIRVFERVSTFTGRAKFSTWLMQVARNVGLDALRAQARRERMAASLPQPRASSPADSGLELTAALMSLSPKHREAVLVVEVFGLTYREAAVVLGAPEGTIKSRVCEARRQLVEWLTRGQRADEM